jgi:translation initiation factor 2B subunit (eIF-2B alpha/beta/delta family)
VLIKAAMRGVQFNVIVTESIPAGIGLSIKKELEEK